MYIASIVAASVFIAAMITIAVFLGSYAVYTKNRLFQKTKLSILVIVLASIVITSLIGFGIFLVFKSNEVSSKKHEFIVQYILIFVLAALTLANFIAYIVITLLNNKNKISYLNLSSINWDEKIASVKNHTNIEQLKTKLATKHKTYYQNMINSYKQILEKAKNSNVKKSELIADIVMFNENFTCKWSIKNNNLQLLLTYEFCKLFNN